MEYIILWIFIVYIRIITNFIHAGMGGLYVELRNRIYYSWSKTPPDVWRECLYLQVGQKLQGSPLGRALASPK